MKKCPSDDTYYREKAKIAIDYAPPIYRCKKCGYPVILGYCCNYCGVATHQRRRNDTLHWESQEFNL